MDRRKGRAPGLIDIYVARRVRQRRLEVGCSQELLAARLGVAVQQIQKYEHGVNRIPASRLIAIAAILEAPVDGFYAGARPLRSIRFKVDDLSLRLDVCDLLIAWADAESDVQRRSILEMVQAALRGQQLKERAPIAFLPRPVRVFSPPSRRPEPDRASAGW